ncbi:hypothetical protein AB0H37_14480, partial [Actinomadura sp. NPDC023710]|uniref:hypothetical protein n=1 Tax=Actinomadura sp. NPDC023710 TaxID=3158219 RepID=UPI0034008B63
MITRQLDGDSLLGHSGHRTGGGAAPVAGERGGAGGRGTMRGPARPSGDRRPRRTLRAAALGPLRGPAPG